MYNHVSRSVQDRKCSFKMAGDILDNDRLFRALYRIRRFEETILDEFPKGRFYGTTHTYLGQEANAVGVLSHTRSDDIVVSNHRCHGHFLAYGGDAHALFAELMGRATGVCGGKGGSQHLQWRNFYSNGVLGGTLPLATGMALAEKLQGRHTVTIVFLGDGTLGEGVVYEALNMAALWNAPILFVVENNRIAQTTPVELNLAGDIAARFSAFGIPSQRLDSSDVLEIHPIAASLLAEIRSQKQPRALVLDTFRFGPHSKGDDTRDPQALDVIRKERDPIEIHARRLEHDVREKIETEVAGEVKQAFDQALQDPLASFEELPPMMQHTPPGQPDQNSNRY
jgi:TPP-dependent pyruvate/acetoin dehydrogenase alpha subunit